MFNLLSRCVLYNTVYGSRAGLYDGGEIVPSCTAYVIVWRVLFYPEYPCKLNFVRSPPQQPTLEAQLSYTTNII